MNNFDFLSNEESDTRHLGRTLGQQIQQSCVIFLEGTLGAGKTRLVQAIASGLDINPESVNSPTFTLMVPHQGRLTLLHVDAYRIKDQDEADQLGIDDWIAGGAVLVVEWAERIEGVLPPADIKIAIEHISDTQRQFTLNANSTLGQNLIQSVSQLAN